MAKIRWPRAKLRTQIHQMLLGNAPIPKQYKIGKPCERGHAVDGKTIRFAETGVCVKCSHEDDERVKMCNAKDEIHRKAMDAYEERLYRNKYDEDPLYV